MIQYQDYDKKLLTFTTKARYVLVPAVVLDKDGNPVTGLKKEDFHLQENGKDQVISNVDEIVPITGPVNKNPSVSANEASNELAIENRAPRRLVIIAIDMVNTPFLDQVRSRQQVIRYLSDSLESDSLYQIVAVENNGLLVLHDYTQSSTDLIATLKKVRSHFTAADRVDTASLANFNSKGSVGDTTGTPGATSVGPTGERFTFVANGSFTDFAGFAAGSDAAAEHPYSEYVAAAAAESTLTAFQQIAERVSGVPGRKSLIWITGGFPFSLDPATARFSSVISFEIYQHVMQELNDEMIAVYPVDARGLLTNNIDASYHLERPQSVYPGAMVTDSANRQHDILETMRSFADMTGGHAYVNTNDTAGAVHSAALDGSRYYLLSYPVDKTNRHQGWRKITVKAGDYHVRARKGYYLTQATVDPSTSARYDVDAALKSPLDYTGIPLRVLLKPQVAAEGKRKLPFSTVISPAGVTVDNADNNHVFLDISYVVLTPDGKSSSKQDKSYNLNLNADQLKQFEAKGLGIGETLDLVPGTYRLRVVVRDNLSGHVGSVLADVRAE